MPRGNRTGSQARHGTSIRISYHLQRLQQMLRRSEQLLDLLTDLQDEPDGQAAYPAMARLFTGLVHDDCQRDNLLEHWRQDVELMRCASPTTPAPTASTTPPKRAKI